VIVADKFPQTDRTRHRRLRNQGSREWADLLSILRSGFVCHLGVIVDGYPMVVPTAYGLSPDGKTIYVHGSVASRSLATQPDATVCLTVTHIDGLVLARSVFEHGVNYRSAMLYGTPRLVTDPDEKLHGLERLTEQVAAGQWAYARKPSKKELAQTSLLAMEIAEASVKIRCGGPSDGDSPDAELPVWAGVVPLHRTWGTPEPADDLRDGIELPVHIAALSEAAGA
jgi:nitroimidazol reductase NimA-like FMN-containing flavoprotein (pyridoxamine 5'-phosphate oxidase superfamily)